MNRQKLTIGVVAAAFTLSLAPAVWAQPGSRPNTTGSSSGSAVPRGGGGSSSGGSSSAGSSSAGSSSSSGSSGSPSMGAPRGGSSSSSGRVRERAPQRPSERAVRRGSGSSDRGASRATASRPSGSDSVTRGRSRADVPTYSRPRENRTVTGRAVERRDGLGTGGGGTIYLPGIYYPYDPFYSNYYGSYYSRYGYYPYSRYWVPGYGFGLGYFAYDPLMFGGYDYYGGGYGGGYSSGGYSSDYDLGNLRLKVDPNDAQVYVDGYFVGPVDSFDGIFQKLGIEAGAHRIELRAEGYETVQFEVLITPGETVTYKGEMKRIRP